MFKETTKQQILSNRYAFLENEEVLVNALDLCDELIAHESLSRAYSKLLRAYSLLENKLHYLDCPEYHKINLKA